MAEWEAYQQAAVDDRGRDFICHAVGMGTVAVVSACYRPPGHWLENGPAGSAGSARCRRSTSKTIRTEFYAAHAGLKGKVWIHHAIECQVLDKYSGLLANEQWNSLQNLLAIPKGINAKLHLKRIRIEWKEFYHTHPSTTVQELLDKAGEIDAKYGTMFEPPVSGFRG